jgi:hypothetical protein
MTASHHKTSLSPPFFIEGHLPSQAEKKRTEEEKTHRKRSHFNLILVK